MQILEQAPSDALRYLEGKKNVTLDSYVGDFERVLKGLRRFGTVDQTTKILEVGTGTGWFTTLCTLRGIECKGIDISPQFVKFAGELARKNGVEAEFETVNIEKADLGHEIYDFVVADSVFEHVQDWRSALHSVHRALKPGGAFLFVSTNKWCLKSGEFSFPLYGWFPDKLRYRIRQHYHGPDIMSLGIDFNQFRFGQLRREFREIGFTGVYDRVERSEPEDIPSPRRRAVFKVCKRSALARHIVLTFMSVTDFMCVK